MAANPVNAYAPTGSTTDNPMNVLSNNRKKKAAYTEDRVSISEEAKELTNELRYKKNLQYVTSEQDASFDKVAKALPSSSGFQGMLEWLSSGKKTTSFSLKATEEADRNVYMKDPKKYAQMWENMYEHFDKTLSGLGITQESETYKEIVRDERVSGNLLYKFTSTLDAETKSMLGYFNIQV